MSPAKGGQDFAGMKRIEKIDQVRVPAFHYLDFHGFHEPADRQPEVIPNQNDGLQPSAVALPQGLHQFGVLISRFGVQPLLELVQHQQYLLTRFQVTASPHHSKRLTEAVAGGQLRELPPQALE
jgi:hypothetical protein